MAEQDPSMPSMAGEVIEDVDAVVDGAMQVEADRIMAELDAADFSDEEDEGMAAIDGVADVDESEVTMEGGEAAPEAGEAPEGSDVLLEDSSLQMFDKHTDSVYAVAMASDKSGIVCSGGGDDTAYLWSAFTGEQTHKLEGHTDSVTAIQFSSDNKMVATGAMDNIVKVWNVESGDLVGDLEGPEDVVTFVDWHPRGPVVLVGSDDCTAWMFKFNGDFMQTFAGHAAEVSCGCFSPDGKTVVTGSYDATVKVWNPRTGQSTLTVAGSTFHTEPILALSLHPTKPVALSAGATGKVALCNLETGRVLQSFNDHKEAVECVAFSPDGSMFASACTEGNIVIREVGTNHVRARVSHEESVVKMQWHASQHLLYTTSADGTTCLWDAKAGSQAKTWSGHTDMPLCMAVDKTGELVVTGGDDKTCLVFSTMDQLPAAPSSE